MESKVVGQRPPCRGGPSKGLRIGDDVTGTGFESFFAKRGGGGAHRGGRKAKASTKALEGDVKSTARKRRRQPAR